MIEFPQPDITDTSRPFWDALNQGDLLFQECEHHHRWLPFRDFCPTCLSDKLTVVKACGRAKLISWVIYNTSMHDAFKNELPYNVSLVQLEEGPKMMTNILIPNEELRAEMPLQLRVVDRGELKLAKFVPDFN